MLTPLLLALLAHAPEPTRAPQLEVVHAGFMHDARLAVTSTERISFRAVVDWPSAVTQRMFVVEGLDAAGRVTSTRTVSSCVEAQSARHKGRRLARFELAADHFVGAETIRVRVAP